MIAVISMIAINIIRQRMAFFLYLYLSGFSLLYLLANATFKNKLTAITEIKSIKRYVRKLVKKKKKINKRTMIKLKAAARIYSSWQDSLGPSQLVSKRCFLKKERFAEAKKVISNSIMRKIKNIISIEDVKL